jgi:hypothetical protein
MGVWSRGIEQEDQGASLVETVVLIPIFLFRRIWTVKPGLFPPVFRTNFTT